MPELCIIVKPHANLCAFSIIATLPKSAKVLETFTFQMTSDQATLFYNEHKGKWFLPRLVKSMTYARLTAFRVSVDGVSTIRTWIGPTDPEEARKTSPNTIRSEYGTQLPNNAIHVSDSIEAGQRELDLIRQFTTK